MTCKYFIKIYSAFKSTFFTESLAIGADINDCVCRLPNHDFPIEDNHSIGRYGWVFDYLPHVHQTSLGFSDLLSAKLRVSFFTVWTLRQNKCLSLTALNIKSLHSNQYISCFWLRGFFLSIQYIFVSNFVSDCQY